MPTFDSKEFMVKKRRNVRAGYMQNRRGVSIYHSI
jgi:hypothetical protein